MSPRNDFSSPDDAARWLARMLDDRRTPAEEAEFDRWLAADPSHERQYQRLDSMWGSVETVRNAAQVKELRREALNEARLASARHRRQASFSRRAAWTVAASLAAIAIAGFLGYRFAPTDRTYQTNVGEQLALTLHDGTELTLNTNSRARVRYSLRTRTVQLERGEAHFKVAHSSLRPFLVNAGTGLIRALGTEFDVDRRADEVRVALVAGKVSVTRLATERVRAGGNMEPAPATEHSSSVVLTAGQAVSVTSAGVSSARPARIDQATAWLEGRLIFNDERLRDAVFEINRYSTQKIIVLDDALADLRVSGIFHTDRADTFIAAVRTSLPVTVQSASEGALLIVPDPARQQIVE